jgi:glutathione S-transferase
MPEQATLWHIAISHYSEKVRWALEHKQVVYERRAPPPGLHIPVALWLTRGRAFTLPILEVEGRPVADSTAIIATLEARVADPPLYPPDAEERRRALELEDFFDEEVGPYMRRLFFHELRRDPERLPTLAGQTMPALTARLAALRYGAASVERAERARLKILAGLDRLERELGDGDYLVGGRFTVADLTAACMLYPLVLPPDGPAVAGPMPEPYEHFRERLRERPGYRWVSEMFARHRHAKRKRATCRYGSAASGLGR